MIEIFRTNVQDISAAERLVEMLLRYFPLCQVSFDLEDCDRILRIKGSGFSVDSVTEIVHRQGFNCTLLE